MITKSKTFALFLILLLASCTRNTYPGIPENAKLIDEAYGIKLFLCANDTADYAAYPITIYSFNSKTQEARQILATGDDLSEYSTDTAAFRLPKNRVNSIAHAQIIPAVDNSLLLVAWGSPNGIYCDTYIISEKDDSATCLPYSRFLGYSIHEDLLITESYAYYDYDEGGTYGILKIYDLNGTLKKHIPLNQKRIP